MGRIYLDYAATTPTHPNVVKTMLPYFTDAFGNPSSIYSYGQEAKGAVEEARVKVACLISARDEEKMAKRQVMFTFPEELIKEPIIYNLSHQFKVVTNIRRADISEDKGWVVLEMEGEEREIERGIDWVKGKGVRVDPVIGDIVEG